MKKIILLTMFVAYSIVSQAQINYGVEIGGGTSNMMVSNPDVTEKFGFRGGAYLTYVDDAGNLALYYETGIAYERKGVKSHDYITIKHRN
jgi:hypothetical protein